MQETSASKKWDTYFLENMAKTQKVVEARDVLIGAKLIDRHTGKLHKMVGCALLSAFKMKDLISSTSRCQKTTAKAWVASSPINREVTASGRNFSEACIEISQL